MVPRGHHRAPCRGPTPRFLLPLPVPRHRGATGVLPTLLRLRLPSPEPGDPAGVMLAALCPAWWLGPSRGRRTRWPGPHLLLAGFPGCDGAGGCRRGHGRPRAATRGKDRAAPFRRLHTKRAFSRVALSRAADLNTENHGKCVLVQRLIIIILKNVDRCLHLSYSANYGQGLNLVRKATCGCKLCASVVLGDSLGVPARVSPERAAPACGSLRTGRASSARCS